MVTEAGHPRRKAFGALVVAVLILASCSNSIDLAVTVVGPAGAPIPGALVRVESSDPETAPFADTTDSSGMASWSDITGEWAEVSVEAVGFVANSGYVGLSDGENELQLALQPVVFDVSVSVTDGEGNPLPGASVAVGGISATTGDDGTALLTGVPGRTVADTLTVTVEAHDHHPASVEADLVMGTEANQVTFGLEWLPYDLEVALVDAAGEPIEGATVGAAGSEAAGHTAVVGPAGIAEFLDLPAPEAIIYAFAPGYRLLETDLIFERGPNQATITLERDPFAIDLASACPEGETLLLAEDFQDARAQGWLIERGWKIAPDSDSGNLALSTVQEPGGGPDPPASTWYLDASFGDVRIKARWLTLTGSVTPGITRETGGELIDGDAVEWAEYRFDLAHTGGLALVARATISRVDHESDGDAGQRSLRSATVNGWPRVARWSDVEMTIRDGAIEVWLDGRRILSGDDPRAVLPEGHLGFTAGFMTIIAHVALDNVVVCQLGG